MSSLLAYGQGFLSGNIGAGAGLTEPWAQSFGWGDGGASQADQDPNCSSVQRSGATADFFSLIQEGAPKEEVPPTPKLTRSSTRKELHWDSPPPSPSTPFVHLPFSVLQLVVTGTKADAVVVGVFQEKSIFAVETLLYLPKSLNFAEFLEFKPDVLANINGKVVCTEDLDLPAEFTRAVGTRPQAFLAQHFPLDKYSGVIFGLWRGVPPGTAEGVFSDFVQSLPFLLTNRINARKYENLGRRFDAVLKVMPEAVVFVDDKCAQVVINPAAAALLELPNHGEVDPSKVAAAMRKLTERCSTRTDPQHWLKLISADDELEIEEDWELKKPRRVLHVRSYPVSSHSAHGRLWLYEDVTAPRDAEEAIEAANKGKSQFLAMMSHELRTPMTGVLGMLDLLQLTPLVPDQQVLMKIMQESAEGLMEVINNILDYCKIEAGRLLLEEIDFSLSDIFEQIHELSKKQLSEKGLELRKTSQPGTRNVVRGDPVRLRQILRNLVSNAIKFTEHGNVTVSWRFLDSQSFDSSVSESSSPPPKRSEYINQIIGAARQDSCIIKLTPPGANGRSVLTVDCSSQGGAIHCADQPATNPEYPGSPRNQSIRKKLPSAKSDLLRTSSDLLERRKRLASEAFQIPVPGRSYKALKNEQRADDEVSSLTTMSGRSPVTVKPIGDVPAHVSEENGYRSTGKSPRLSPEHLRMIEEKHFLTDKHSSCKIAPGAPEDLPRKDLDRPVLGSNPSDSTNQSRMGSFPVPDVSLIMKSVEQYTGSTDTAELESPQMNPTASVIDSVNNFGSVTARDVSGRKASLPEVPQICKLCGGVKYGVSSAKVDEEDKVEQPSKIEENVWLEVKISDTGVGIGVEQLQNLFVASQAGSQRRDAAGTGLGLAICKGLLGLIGGKLEFDTKRGEGTVVTVTMPLLPAGEAVEVLVEKSVPPVEKSISAQSCSSQAPTQPQQPKKPVEKSTLLNVLVAEDNVVNQLLIRKMFRHYGHVVDVVGNGKLAVEAVQRRTYDLVLMDVQMPILDGLSATKAIRALPAPTSSVPIYALSADTPGSGPMEETGLDGYLSKPISWEKMSGLVERTLAAKNSVL